MAGISAPAEARPAARSWPGLEWAAAWPEWQRRAAWLVVATSLVRLVVIATTGLSDTEAYYYVWSRFPSLSYYDHPPLIAWMTWVTTLASKSAFAVRIGPVICTAVFGALLYRLAARLFSPRAGFIAVATVSILPAFVFTGFLANPEAPLAPLWVLYLLLLDDMRRHGEPWRPLLLGLVIGVAFLAKYTAVLAVPLTLLVLASGANTRRWLRRPSLYAGGLVALAVTSPVIVWNFAHGWPSIALHLVERMPPASGATFASNALRVAVGQIALFHPLVFPGLLAVLAITAHRARTDERYRLLALTSGPTLLFFYVVMARACDAEPHWTMVGYVPVAVAAGGWLDERLDRPSRSLTWYLRSCVAFSGALAVLYAVHMRTAALLRLVPAASYDANADPINETLGWDDVRSAIEAESARLGPGAVIASDHNVLCGHIAAEMDDRPAVYCPSPRRTEFDFLGRRDPPADAPVIYVDSARYPGDPAALLPGWSCAAASRVEVERGGRPIGTYRIHACLPETAARGGGKTGG